MRTVSVRPFGFPIGLLLLTALAAGCSRGSRQPASVQEILGQIGVAYNEASMKTRRPPRSAEELKPLLRRFGDPEAILVSPNDGQPFTIRWGVSCFQPGRNGVNPILAHEAVGIGGKKYALNNMLNVRQMTEAELDQALQANK